MSRLKLVFVAMFFFFLHLHSGELLLPHASISVYAINTETGEVLIDQNGDLSLIPASCMKAVTTGAALHLLEPEMRFETHLEYDGTIDSSKTLHGNIYIRGGGDPCLGSDRIEGNPSWEKQIEIWANAIEKLGIQTIEGCVIGDATRWEKALAAPSWSWEDLGNYYGAGASALSFHENSYSLVFRPSAEEGEITSILRTDPPLQLVFQNEVVTGPEGSGDQACIFGCEFSPLQMIRGTIPANVKEFAIKGAIPDPASFCADLLAKKLLEKGIKIQQKDLNLPQKRVSFHTTYSPTLKEIVYWTNQKSINLYAEHLLKKLGEVIHQEGSTQAGIRAVREFWQSQGISLEGSHIIDGSGLSRKNLLTTKQLVNMLRMMKDSKYFPVFFESLAQIENSIRAKSGTMSLVKGYAGYSGNIAFAVLINQCPDSQKMQAAIHQILTKLNEIGKSSNLHLKAK